MKAYETIQFELNNSIGTIWLNRPDVHNALNEQMISEIISCVEEAGPMKEC